MVSAWLQVNTWFSEATIERLLEVLAHSLWQGTILALGLWLILLVLPVGYVRLRYSLAVAMLPVLVFAVALTWSVLGAKQADVPDAESSPFGIVTQVSGVIDEERAQRSTVDYDSASGEIFDGDSETTSGGGPGLTAPESSGLAKPQIASLETVAEASRFWGGFFDGQGAAAILMAWLVIAALLVTRTVLGFELGRHRLTRGGVPADSSVQRLADRVVERLRLRYSVTVIQQAGCVVPCVLGVFKPVVLLPPAVLIGLTSMQLEAVLAHELAHVRRWDAVVNFTQRLLANVLFFNPGVYWINRQIRQEREACCDMIAAEVVGDPAIVVEALHVVARLASPSEKEPTYLSQKPTPALAATDGQLKDRVMRLLMPGCRQRTALRWPSVLAVLCLSTASLWLVERGAEATIVLAEDLFNPKAYIEDTQRFVEEGGALNEDWAKLSHSQGNDAEEAKGTVSGTIRSADGSPLGEQLSLTINSDRPSSGGYALGWSTRPGPTPDVRTFHCDRVPAGIVSVRVSPSKLAPFETKQALLRPGEVMEGLEIVLDKGFAMELQVVDPQGNPIAAASLESAFVRFTSGHSGSVMPGKDARQTDGQGILTLDRLIGPTNLEVILDAPGFERTSAKTRSKPNGIWRIALAEAKPVTGVVLDADTQQPLAGVQVHAIYRTGVSQDPRASYYKEDPLAVTDAAGRFELDGFSGSEKASLWFDALGKMPKVLWDVNGGDDLRVSLSPTIDLRVELIGPVTELKRNREGQPIVSLSQSLRIKQDSSQGRSFKAVVKTDDQGKPFAVFDRYLMSGKAQVFAGKKVVAIEDLESTEMILVDLQTTDAKASGRASREIVIEFVPPDGWPAPEGNINVSAYFEADQRYRRQRMIVIKEGKAHLTVLLNPENQSHKPSVVLLGRLEAPGYWLPKTDIQDVVIDEDTQEQQVFRVNVLPAGVIRGRVVDEDGKPLGQADLSLQKIEEPRDIFGANRTDPNWWNNIDADHEGRFVITPVPFGGVYMPMASARSLGRYGVGFAKPVTLSAKQPHAEITIVVPRGKDASVTVMDPDGKPIADAELEIHRSSPGGSNSWSPNEFTDGQGQFVFKHLNLSPEEIEGVKHTINVLPHGPYKGVSYEVDPKKPDRVLRLEHGKALSAVLLDHASGKPLADVKVWVQQVNAHSPDAIGFSGPVRGQTDEQGRVVLQGLEDTAYRVRVDGYYMQGTRINRDQATGRVLSVSPADWPVVEPTDQDGKPALKLRVIMSPWG